MGPPELVRDLASKVDVLVENFRPGVMDQYGLGWSDLHALNPKLVMLSVSGFGQEGPERDRAAYAPVVQAETGLIDRFSQIMGHYPHDLILSVADTNAGLHGTIGVLAAVIMAQRTGVGQHVDISMINSQYFTDDYMGMIAAGDPIHHGGGDVWQVAGGPIIIAAQFRFLWRTLAAHAGLEDPGDEAGQRAAVAAYLAAIPTQEEVIALMDELRIAWGHVRLYQDAMDSPSIGPRKIMVEVDDRVGGKRLTTQSPYWFSDADSGARGPAPYRGEHNREILSRWLGRSDTEIDALEQAGVLLEQERP